MMLASAITEWGVLIGVVFTGVVAVMESRKTRAKVADVATKVAAVDAKAEENVKQGEAIHTLVNSANLELLDGKAVALETLAAAVPTPENKHRAEVARAAFADHQKKQAVVDARPATKKN